jgi:hypothetical protein
MPSREINNQQEVIRQLAERAAWEKTLAGSRGVKAKPGEMIQSLGPVKRQILKDLTSEDMKNDRWPR